MDYRVRLEIFEGPLDLLLHLIKKNEVDIYDIPISEITAQYLEYLDLMKEMNLNVAGEFIVMAATLLHIKSRMLLPRPELPGLEDEGPDPREELTQRLLEYQRYREASEALAGRTMLGRDVFPRGAMGPVEAAGREAALDVSLFALVEALKEVLERAPSEYVIETDAERFTVSERMNHVLEVLGGRGTVTFGTLFEDTASRAEMITTFLALLELARLLLVRLHQTEDGTIRVFAAAPEGASGRGPSWEAGAAQAGGPQSEAEDGRG